MSDSQHPNEDLTLFVHDMLNQMSTRFSVMGDSIMGQMDQMGSRMNDLESSINQLMDQAGLTPMSDTLPSSSADSNKKPSVAKVWSLKKGGWIGKADMIVEIYAVVLKIWDSFRYFPF